MTVYVSAGTIFSRGNSDSPLTYTAIAQVQQIGSVGQSRGLIDTTNLSSSAREYKKAIKDGSEIELKIQYDPDDTGHAALKTDNNAETSNQYRVTFTDSPAQTVTFAGLVTNWEVNQIEIDQVLMLDVTIKPTGDLTFA